MSSGTKQLGLHGEERVVAWLSTQGFRLCARNYRVSWGEIDIVAEKGNILAMVEVKARRNNTVPALAAINRAKQQRILAVARHYVVSNQIEDRVVRFDVATVVETDAGTQLSYIEDAFRDE